MGFRIFFTVLLLIYASNSCSLSRIDCLLAHNLSAENEHSIRAIIKDMNMANRNITLRAVNNEDETLLDQSHAFLMSNDTSVFLFIDEKWFNTLNNQEKRAFIGNELIHLEANRSAKQEAFLEKSVYAAIFVVLLSIAIVDLLDKWYSRKCERESDIEGAKRLQCARGGVDLWQRHIDEEKKQFNSWFEKAVIYPLYRLDRFFFPTHPLSTHPGHEERRTYMEELAKQQEL